MQRKIFIGVEISPKIKNRLSKIILEKWENLPVSWSREENFHITLNLLGHVKDEMITEICEKVKNACENIEAFDIEFEKIMLAPDIESPRVFWLIGKPSNELKNIYELIEKKLGIFVSEKKEFRPHVILGRIKKEKWSALNEKPEINEKFLANFIVDNVVVFESKNENGKRKFIPLENCPLN